MAPAITPGSIIGTVTFLKVWNSVEPRLIAASSILGLICEIIAVLDRIVYGIRLIASDRMIIIAVPLSNRGLVLKAYKKEIPRTEPGII